MDAVVRRLLLPDLDGIQSQVSEHQISSECGGFMSDYHNSEREK